ncbi:nucleotide pyrophosphohydrolase [bacterium]|nr:nucleotide pyrophosphohydrolase [bacterium]
MKISDFQKRIKDNFYHKDEPRGALKTFMWLVEEIGELSSSLMESDKKNQAEELSDVIAWAFSLANVLEIDLEKVLMDKYPQNCSCCQESPCSCSKK